MKYFDTERSSTALPASADWTGTEFPPNVGTPTTLVCPTVGSAINQRIGRDIYVHKISIKGIFAVPAQANQTATDGGCLIRYALVEDSQANSTQCQGEQIFAAPTTAAATMSISSHMSLANFGRFRILKDKMIKLDNPNLSWDGSNMEQQGMIKPFKLKHKFKKPCKVTFNATNGGTISDVVNYTWTPIINATNIDLAPVVVYNARVYYKETKY
jgi:hypothetical protein